MATLSQYSGLGEIHGQEPGQATIHPGFAQGVQTKTERITLSRSVHSDHYYYYYYYFLSGGKGVLELLLAISLAQAEPDFQQIIAWRQGFTWLTLIMTDVLGYRGVIFLRSRTF